MKARTVAEVMAGEARSPEDLEMIASVIANRAQLAGVSPESIVAAPGQFDAYGKSLPPGVTKKDVAKAKAALGKVLRDGVPPQYQNAIGYARDYAVDGVPDTWQPTGIVTPDKHVVFSDPAGGWIATTAGYVAPKGTIGGLATSTPAVEYASAGPAGQLYSDLAPARAVQTTPVGPGGLGVAPADKPKGLGLEALAPNGLLDKSRPNVGDAIASPTTNDLVGRLVGHTAEHVTGMSPDLRGRLEAMFDAAPPDIAGGLGIFSGYRSVERQRQLFDASDRTGRMVARPGYSKHNLGTAADLSYNGQSLARAPQAVKDWVHENAPRFGLSFPMSYEPWHVETVEARNPAAFQPGFPSDVPAPQARPDEMAVADNAGFAPGLQPAAYTSEVPAPQAASPTASSIGGLGLVPEQSALGPDRRMPGGVVTSDTFVSPPHPPAPPAPPQAVFSDPSTTQALADQRIAERQAEYDQRVRDRQAYEARLRAQPPSTAMPSAPVKQDVAAAQPGFTPADVAAFAASEPQRLSPLSATERVSPIGYEMQSPLTTTERLSPIASQEIGGLLGSQVFSPTALGAPQTFTPTRQPQQNTINVAGATPASQPSTIAPPGVNELEPWTGTTTLTDDFPPAPEAPKKQDKLKSALKQAAIGAAFGGLPGAAIGLASGLLGDQIGGLGGLFMDAGAVPPGERFNAGYGIPGIEAGMYGARGATGFSRSNPGAYTVSRGPGLGWDLTNDKGVTTRYSPDGHIVASANTGIGLGGLLGGLFGGDRSGGFSDKERAEWSGRTGLF
jgi:D-alanyl-D-alanine carboxypeptidase